MSTIERERPMMKCGCAAQGTCSSLGGITYNPPVPACLVHDCIEQIDVPHLSGRLAKCDCGNTKESSTGLPFFTYLGAGSLETQRRCKCGFYEVAHWPRWRASIRVVRRWFKIERDDSITVREFNAPDALKEQGAENEADFFRSDKSEETKVFSVEVVRIEPVPNRHKCKQFEPMGPQQFDRYYCGCRGWD